MNLDFFNYKDDVQTCHCDSEHVVWCQDIVNGCSDGNFDRVENMWNNTSINQTLLNSHCARANQNDPTYSAPQFAANQLCRNKSVQSVSQEQWLSLGPTDKSWIYNGSLTWQRDTCCLTLYCIWHFFVFVNVQESWWWNAWQS